MLSGPEVAVGWLVDMSLVVAVMVCSMGGAGGFWTSVGGVMEWWSLRYEASGGLAGEVGMMSGAEVMLGSCASVGDAMWWQLGLAGGGMGVWKFVSV